MGIFGKSWSTSSTTDPGLSQPSPQSIASDTISQKDATPQPLPPLLRLPSEIIQQILSYLSPQHLVSLCRTCHHLRSHAIQETLWLDMLSEKVPVHDFPSSPAPFPSYRELYLAHHPNWFLPYHKIWFSDDDYTGKLILIKFNPKRGSIEGYRIAAERPPATPEIWSYKPNVLIHHLNPRVYVSVTDPVLALSPPIPTSSNNRTRTSWSPSAEIPMRVGAPTQKIDASLLLSIDLPEMTASAPSVSVWPPRIIPDMPRTRSSSSSGARDRFTSRKHKPQTLQEISQTTFRLRTWSHFTQGMRSLGVRIGEEINTWSTLSPEIYQPTSEKPYQGIFVGDYAAHGCEFLLILQSDSAPPNTHSNREREDVENRPSRYLPDLLAALSDDGPINLNMLMGPLINEFKDLEVVNPQDPVEPNVPDPEGNIHKGAIEAIKLTGDINVPRGEHTFVADDIGPTGMIRIAAERPFRGARVVKSRGHVASRGFQEDEFIPSQLFLISPDLLAQYWLPFGHISFYKRIDIDGLLRDAGSDGRRASSG